jgi:hypothetical protein
MIDTDRLEFPTPVAFEIEIFVAGPMMISQPGEIFLVTRGQDGGHRLGIPVRIGRGLGRLGPAAGSHGERQGQEDDHGEPEKDVHIPTSAEALMAAATRRGGNARGSTAVPTVASFHESLSGGASDHACGP